MTRARALVSAVPSRVWTAIAGLVLLASLGVTLVLGAGLATWRGGVSRTPLSDGARPPVTGTTPPGSAVVVVPTPAAHGQHPAQPPTVTTVAVAPASGVAPVTATAATPPVPAAVPPPVPPAQQPAGPPVTAHPRVTGPGATTAGHGKSHVSGHARSHGHVAGKTHGHAAGEHGGQGKHLGWVHNKHAD